MKNLADSKLSNNVGTRIRVSFWNIKKIKNAIGSRNWSMERNSSIFGNMREQRTEISSMCVSELSMSSAEKIILSKNYGNIRYSYDLLQRKRSHINNASESGKMGVWSMGKVAQCSILSVSTLNQKYHNEYFPRNQTQPNRDSCSKNATTMEENGYFDLYR